MKWRQAIYQIQSTKLVLRILSELREGIRKLMENFNKEIGNKKRR